MLHFNDSTCLSPRHSVDDTVHSPGGADLAAGTIKHLNLAKDGGTVCLHPERNRKALG
jgi:hypothetical protein